MQLRQGCELGAGLPSHTPPAPNGPRCPYCRPQVQRQTAVKPVARSRCVTKALSDVNLVVGGERRR